MWRQPDTLCQGVGDICEDVAGEVEEVGVSAYSCCRKDWKMKTLRWLFWWTTYKFRRQPRTLQGWLKRTERCRSPYWKFKPYVWHNDPGKMWEVSLVSDRCHNMRAQITVDAGFSMDTGEVVELKIWDSELRRIADQERERDRLRRA